MISRQITKKMFFEVGQLHVAVGSHFSILHRQKIMNIACIKLLIWLTPPNSKLIAVLEKEALTGCD